MTRVLLLATHNRGKVREFAGLLSELPIELRSLAQVDPSLSVIEDGATFEANARKKAREIALATGMLVLADDSGLEVDALGGQPGVHSARYAGPTADDAANNLKLIAALRDVPDHQRTARYRVVLALADPSGPLGDSVQLAHGTCEGRIQRQPRGQHGFGYDPYFVPVGHTRTMAELPAAEKHQLSHRAEAARQISRFLAAYLARPRIPEPGQP
jgi:XTP/dITP diphosphohydrolase